MAQVLLEIAQNASIRGMRVDGVDLFSVYDFIKYVCPGHNSIYAPTIIV
jgi:TPP-dependent pyruvate/acetoin dehydrogenase alpha subunit